MRATDEINKFAMLPGLTRTEPSCLRIPAPHSPLIRCPTLSSTVRSGATPRPSAARLWITRPEDRRRLWTSRR